MSTIVAVKKNGIAVIGADTLTKFGSMKQGDILENNTKIIMFGVNFLAYVGDCAFGHALRTYLAKLKTSPSLSNPDKIFEFSCKLHKKLKEDFYLRPEEDEDDDFESSRFESLIVNRHGIFGLYSLRSVDEYSKFFSFGSGSRYALGAMQTVYGKYDSAEDIAKAGLEA
ncbi:MAG: hypothetical protein A2Y21_06835, partial [Clostridiales bacterium GWC2_40_7]